VNLGNIGPSQSEGALTCSSASSHLAAATAHNTVVIHPMTFQTSHSMCLEFGCLLAPAVRYVCCRRGSAPSLALTSCSCTGCSDLRCLARVPPPIKAFAILYFLLLLHQLPTLVYPTHIRPPPAIDLDTLVSCYLAHPIKYHFNSPSPSLTARLSP
jgi:hypothetical protein